LSDAQTSGGLLMTVPSERAASLQDALLAAGVLAARIWRVEDGTGLAVEAAS
jgi:AIR synthase related protein, C-terminal domain